MKTKLAILSLFFCTQFLQAQGNFVNLGFEAANLTPTSQDGFGGFVPVSQGIPGWNGFVGTNQLSSVLQNNRTLGGPNISIFSPNWTAAQGIIEGQYTVLLQAGLSSTAGFVDASLSQTGWWAFHGLI